MNFTFFSFSSERFSGLRTSTNWTKDVCGCDGVREWKIYAGNVEVFQYSLNFSSPMESQFLFVLTCASIHEFSRVRWVWRGNDSNGNQDIWKLNDRFDYFIVEDLMSLRSSQKWLKCLNQMHKMECTATYGLPRLFADLIKEIRSAWDWTHFCAESEFCCRVNELPAFM